MTTHMCRPVCVRARTLFARRGAARRVRRNVLSGKCTSERAHCRLVISINLETVRFCAMIAPVLSGVATKCTQNCDSAIDVRRRDLMICIECVVKNARKRKKKN